MTRLYSLGPYAIIIGARAEESVDYMAPVRQALHELTDGTALTSAWIQRAEADRLMYVAKEEGTADTHVSISVGNRFPLAKVSWGSGWSSPTRTPRTGPRSSREACQRSARPTLPTRVEYVRQCERARESRILTTSGDYMPGIWAASAPVLSHGQRLIGILSVIAVADLMPEADREKYADLGAGPSPATPLSMNP